MNLFTEKELIIMASIIGVLLVLVIILTILEMVSKRKNKNNFKEVLVLEDVKKVENESILETKEELVELNEEKVLEVALEIEPSSSLEVEPLIIDDLDVPLVTKIEKDENVLPKEKAQIELLKIENELENTLSLEDTITNLEAIEEESAIISYQELLENTKELNVVLEDDGDEPITIDEVFKMFNEENDGLQIIEALDAIPLSEAYQGEFESTPYLSPITGLETENLSEIQLENTANLEKLDREIRKTNEFLNILNELKKNLD